MPFTKLVILSLTLLLLSAGSSIAKPFSINFSHSDGRDSLKGKASEYFKRLIEQRSNNRIMVSINPDQPADTHPLVGLQSDRIQMAALDISKLYALAPQLRLFELPFLFNDIAHLHMVLDSEVGTQLLESASQNGLVALSFWDNGFRQLTANQPLRHPQQAEGLKINIIGTEILKQQFRMLGAEPLTIPPAQLYAALAANQCDGQENTLSSIVAEKLYLVQSDLTVSNHSYTGYLVSTNSKFWSQLPDDLKVIMRGAIHDATAYARDMAIRINDDALKVIVAADSLKMHILTQAERELWANHLELIATAPDKDISYEHVRKAREKQIR